MTISTSPASDTLDPEPVPHLQSTPTENILAHSEEFSDPWRMQQAWLEKEQAGFQAATVSMAWQADSLSIVALLPDREIFSKSTADGEYLWSLGDVFEVFIRRENSPQYLELHVSPNGHQLHLRWTEADMGKVGEGKATVDEFVADSRAFEATVVRLPDASGWAVTMLLPAKILPDATPFQKGERLAVSFSRYDTDENGENAILSSTSPHDQLSFHRLHEWQTVVLK